MNAWLLAESALSGVVVVAWLLRARLGGRFQTVSLAACALLVLVAVTESLVDRPHLWSVGLGALALGCFVVGIVRQAPPDV